jgi:hypothetical protein
MAFSMMQSNLVLHAPTLVPHAGITLQTASPVRALASLMEILVLVVMDTTTEDQPLALPVTILVSPAPIVLLV